MLALSSSLFSSHRLSFQRTILHHEFLVLLLGLAYNQRNSRSASFQRFYPLLHFTLATRFSLDSSLSSAVPAQDTPEALRLMRSFSFSSTPTLLVHVGQALRLLEFRFFLFTCFSVPSIMLCIRLWASLPCLSFKFCFNQQVNPTRHPRSIN